VYPDCASFSRQTLQLFAGEPDEVAASPGIVGPYLPGQPMIALAKGRLPPARQYEAFDGAAAAPGFVFVIAFFQVAVNCLVNGPFV
jgi:hypothetical protein